MNDLKKLVESSDVADLRKVYDATERLDAAYVLKYPIDFAAAARQAEAIGAGSTVQEFIQLANEMRDKFNRMHKILVAARHDLGKFKEVR